MTSKKDLTKFLSELKEGELIKEIQKLYAKFPAVKTYYDVELSGNTSSFFNKAKEQIENEFYPKRGEAKARSSVIKKVIDDFAKISIYPNDIVELYLFRFEKAVQFQNDYGDMDDPFYNSACNAFAKALSLAKKHGYLEEIRLKVEKAIEIMGDTGWGFSDSVNQIYYDYYG